MNKTQFKQNDYALCPYFRKQGKDGITIKCEGCVGTHVIHVFHNKKDMLEHSESFCCGCYEGCWYYVLMTDKWVYEHENG